MTELLHSAPRKILREIIETYDEKIWATPQGCKAFLQDLCGEYRLEISLLAGALEENVVDALRASSSLSLPYQGLRVRLAKLLHENRGQAEDFALWTVDSWALGLGMFTDEALTQLLVAPTEIPPSDNEKQLLKSINKKLVRGPDARQTFIVSQQEHADYSTISAAVRNAPARSLILVEPGVYAKESIRITKQVDIIGQGDKKDIIIENDTTSCLKMRATSNAVVQGVTLRSRSQKDATVDISNGSLLLKDCLLLAEDHACIAIHGKPASVQPPTSAQPPASPSLQLRACELHYKNKHALLISNKMDCIIEDCLIHQQRIKPDEVTAAMNAVGIKISLQGGATFRKCEIRHATGWAVLADEQAGNTNSAGTKIAGVKLWECSILGEKLVGEDDIQHAHISTGVEIGKQSYLALYKCFISQEKGNGILVRDDGQGIIEACTIFNNSLASVEVKQHGNALIKGGQIYDGLRQGVFIHEHGMATIEENCDIYGNELAGVKIIQGDAPIILKNCSIHDGKGNGLLILQHGQAITSIEECKIFSQAHAGIEIRDGGEPEIKHCEIYANKGWGVLCSKNSKSSITDCKIYDNTYVGVEVKKGELRLQDSWISHNAYHGILLSAESRGSIENSHFVGNGRSRWYRRDKGQVKLIVNKLSLLERVFQFVWFPAL